MYNQTRNTMRCRNCGWENPEGTLKCEKCNTRLSVGLGSGAYAGAQDTNRESAQPMNATVRESSVFGTNSGNTSNPSEMPEKKYVCSNCGYEMVSGTRTCPACGTPVGAQKAESEQRQQRPSAGQGVTCAGCGAQLLPNAQFCPQCGRKVRMGTVNVWDKPRENDFCTLKPLSWSNEEVNYNPISYSGQMIVLNRSNTDPNNQSITSKEQAVLIHEDNTWYIEDRSEMKSTMIRVSRKTKLESGDVIVLGNRLFEFKG